MLSRLRSFISEQIRAETLQIRIFRLFCFLTGWVCLVVVCPANFIQDLPWWVDVGNIVLGLVSWGFFWESKRGRQWFIGYYLLALLLFDLLWLGNGGSHGPMTYFLLASVLYPMALFRGRVRWAVVLALVLNICALFVAEHLLPSLVFPYAGKNDRLMDLITGVACSALAMALVLWKILESHDREQQRLAGLSEQLATSERSYREIFNATSDALFVYAESGRLLDVNERACAEFRCTREEMLGLTVDALSLGERPFSRNEAVEKLRLARRDGPQTFLWRSRRTNGELFWSEVALRSCMVNGRRRVISSVRDISRRMQAEEALRYNEERFRLALLASNQGWFDLDVASGEGTASAEYATVIGRAPENFRVTAQTWLDGVHPDDRELLGRVYQECLRSGDPRTMEYRRQSATGEWKWIRSVGKVVAFDDFGNPLRLIGTHTDITERKELEAKLLNSQRLETVGTLAGGVAHDLNNILTPILMSTSVLRGNLREPADRELIALLEQGAQRGAAIVRQLLTFSRNMEQKRSPLNLRPMIQETLRALRPGLVQGIVVVENVEAELWPVVAAAVQMQQVLANLCANALDAMPAGGVLTVSAVNTEFGDGVTSRNPWGKAGRFVTLTVSDTGRGIAPENIGRIFDPFFTTKEVGQGPGLGLSAVFGIVKAHGGNVSVASEPGQGAVFRVVLPAEIATPQVVSVTGSAHVA